MTQKEILTILQEKMEKHGLLLQDLRRVVMGNGTDGLVGEIKKIKGLLKDYEVKVCCITRHNFKPRNDNTNKRNPEQ